MKKHSVCKLSVFSFVLMLFVALAFSVLAMDKKDEPVKSDAKGADLLADSSEKIVLVSASGTEYKLYFSSDSRSEDRDVANDVSDVIRELYDIRMRANADVIDKASAKEILIGDTNRAESKSFLKRVKNTLENPDDLAWGFAMINGKFVYTANYDEAFTIGAADLIDYLVKNDFTVPSNLVYYGYMSRAEYDQKIKEEEEAARAEIVAELLEINSQFTQKDFGGPYKLMFTGASPYNPPETYPTTGQHPRIFITEDKIDELLVLMEDKDFSALTKAFWAEVNEECDGKFERVDYEDPEGKWTNFNGEDWYAYDDHIVSVLQNKAFAYLLTGNEVYGYEAIIGAKNMILTLMFSTYLHTDLYHGPSRIMNAVAEIYDWCYDLLTEDDKNQLIAGVSNILCPNMELKFPPSDMNAVSGHGTGPQFLRDYFMVAVAFYDEVPNWWEFVGGRYYQEYVPAAREVYKNGWLSQGTAVYGQSKFYDGIISARLVYLATGQFPYVEEDIIQTAYFTISHLQPNGRLFQTGDGPRNPTGKEADFAYSLFDIAATFQDAFLTSYIYQKTANLSQGLYANWSDDMSYAKRLAYLAYFPEPEEGDPYEKIDTIQYFPDPAGNMTARSSWSSDAAAVMMKIGTRTLANHDILDHGTFQIYYKGLLAGTSGMYKKYNSNVHKYYLQSTVAHNGILVFNPAYAVETPVYTAGSGYLGAAEITNGSYYFYSGGQRARAQAGAVVDKSQALNYWLTSEYDMGKITGYDIGYTYDGESEYGYIAGDITSSYDTKTVSYLERRMLTIFTGDPDYPMLFFTFDTIESADASFAKYSLLHTTKEPEIDEDNLSADIREADGRLYVQALFGADNIEKVGGEGRAHWINGYYNTSGKYVEGKNCVDTYAPVDSYESFWGRVQFSSSGKKETQMLTAMFVTDASNNETPEFKSFENSDIYGAEFGGIYTVFLKSREAKAEAFSFRTSGKGLSKYYISGIGEGVWSVKVDGIPVANIGVDAENAFASIIIPSGNVTFEPLNIGTAASISEDSVTEEAKLAAAPYTEDAKISAPEGETPLTWCALPSVSEDKFQVLSKANKHALVPKH